MKKTVFTLLFMSVLGTQAIFAQTVTVDGVKYEKISWLDGQAKVAELENSDVKELAIPAEVTLDDGNKYAVTTIGDNVFKDNATLTSIQLPNTLVQFWDNAFKGCTALKSITIPASVENIYNYVFYNSSIESITFEEGSKLALIGNYAFSQAKLKNVVLPASVVHIQDNAFSNMPTLESITLSESLEDIGDYAFGKTGLKSIAFPSKLKTIVKYAFADTPSLETITTMSPVLETIGDHAFKGTSLKSITLPNTLKTIGEYAFEGTKLPSIVIPSSVETMDDGVFYNCTDLKTATINSDKVELKWQLFRLGADDQTGLTDLYITPEKAVKIGWCIATSQPINIHVQPKLVEEYQKSFAAVDRKNDNIDSKMKITLGQEYASFSSAFNVDFSNVEGLKAYKGAYDADKNEVVLTQTLKVSAWNGVILKGEAGQTYEADILDAWTEGMDDFSDNKIYASVDPTWLKGVNGGDYVLSNGAFHPIAKEGFVAAGRAYLPLASITGSTSAAKELTLSFGDPTGINAMTANKTNANATVYFNIAGVKASQPMKGLNISNGKKFYNNK